MTVPISPKEQNLIRQLRNRVSDVVPEDRLQDDYFLCRWIRARDHDLEKAEYMLRKAMAWMARNEAANLIAWKPPYNYVRYALLGHDEAGCPVYLFPVGFWEILEATEAGDIVPSFRCMLRVLALIEHEMKMSTQRLGKPITQANLIFDFQEFAYLRHLNNRTVVQGGIEFCKIFEANCPESIKSCMCINTASLFKLGFSIIKPFMSGKTVGKLEIFGSDKKKWMPVIRSRFPEEILPPHYGGTRTGRDEFCSDCNMWNDGEPLPPNSFDLFKGKGRRNTMLDFNMDDADSQGEWKREEIPAGRKIDIDFPVSQESIKGMSNILRWRIVSENYDIGFQVMHIPTDPEMNPEVVRENRSIDSHIEPVEGSLICQSAGTYRVTLDNSYSRVRNKAVMYNIFLTRPLAAILSDQVAYPTAKECSNRA